MNLENKVALITGPKRIGAAVADELARRGAHVGLSYNRSKADAQRVVASVEALGRQAIATQANVSRAEDCERLVATTVSELGRLDVLVNMASTYVRKSFDDLTESDLDRALSVDLKAAYLCSLAVVPHLRRAGTGRIVNFTDWVAQSGRPRYSGYLPYYVAKSAIIGLTEALALELASDNILVNAIAPGPIMPPPDLKDSEIETVQQAVPLGRWGGADEIVKVVVALVESDFITGEMIRVDGGRHLK